MCECYQSAVYSITCPRVSGLMLYYHKHTDHLAQVDVKGAKTRNVMGKSVKSQNVICPFIFIFRF